MDQFRTCIAAVDEGSFSAAGRKLRRAQSVVSQTLANWEAQLGVKLIESERTTGIYRRMVVTSSGRFAMLDDDLGFSLVPWVPVIEKRLGQSLTVVIRGESANWRIGKQLSR